MISFTGLPTIKNAEESRNQIKDMIHKATYANLGVTKLVKRFINRDIGLWNDDVKMKVRKKNRLYSSLLSD